jgi:hypothetical protein
MKPLSVEFAIRVPGDEYPTPVEIREDEVASLTAAELRRLRITRKKMRLVFDRARELMRDVRASDRLRVCADEMLNGDFLVVLLGSYRLRKGVTDFAPAQIAA